MSVSVYVCLQFDIDFVFSPLRAEANKYFVDYISKAYQALTDPASRENYEKYGHPDGRQVCETGHGVVLKFLIADHLYNRLSTYRLHTCSNHEARF